MDTTPGADDGAEQQLRAGRRRGCFCAMVTMGATDAKVTPIITGSLMPNQLRGAQRLDQRGDAAAEQVGGDQQRDFLGAQLQGAADDERHGDGAGIHHQHMLQAQGREPAGRKFLVNGMDLGSHGFSWVGSVLRGGLIWTQRQNKGWCMEKVYAMPR